RRHEVVVHLPAGDDRAHARRDGDDLADEVARQVDDVGAEVAEGAGSGPGGIEPPEGRVRAPAPRLQVAGAEVDDLAELAGLEQLAREPDGGDEAVVEAAHVLYACTLGRSPYFVRLGGAQPERLLAEDVLAGLRGGDRRLGVDGVRAAVVEEADPLVG